VSLSKPQQLRQRIGGIRRHQWVSAPPPRDPGADITELRVQLREAKAEQYIQKLLAETPPLSAEERLHLTRLLTSPLLSGGDVA
jgi:hypothetical protein